MNYATEMVAVLADSLTDEERQTVSLVLLSELLNHHQEGPLKVFDLDVEEMEEIAMTVASQLAVSGLTDSKEFGVLSRALLVLDGLADFVPRRVLQDLSTARGRLVQRVAVAYTKHGFLTVKMARALRSDPFLRRLEDRTT